MKILEILNEEALLLESGIRIPKGILSAKILHHSDYDGVMSAVAMGLQLKKQGISKITTQILFDGEDNEYDNMKKLAKNKHQMLVVVDFDRFKDKDVAKKQIDVQTDHHASRDPDNKNTSAKSVGKTEFGSDVMHISTAVAQGFITGSDLAIMNGIDSARFTGNLLTNIDLQRDLSKNDGVANKKMRLAIITSSILGQLIKTNPGSIQSIIDNLMKSPSVLKFYTEVKSHIKIQKKQANLLDAFIGKKNGKIDWDAINEYNETAPKQMRIGITRSGTIRKSNTKDKEAASEEELGKRNREGQMVRDLEVDSDGKMSLVSKDVGDAKLTPWGAKDKFKPISKAEKDRLWKKAETEAREDDEDKWASMSAEEKKKKIVGIWKKSLNELQKGAPRVLRQEANISKTTDMKGNRYLSFADPTIMANIRDFWKFWQMSIKPDVNPKFTEIAKNKGIDFDLIDLGKKSLEKAKKEMFTIEEMKRRGFRYPEKVLTIFNTAYTKTYTKSGGHKSITNIDLKPLFKETADKYDNLAKRAKAVNRPDLKSFFEDEMKKYSTFLREFKERTQDIMSKAVQGRIDIVKGKRPNTLIKDSILFNSGMELNESNQKRREWKKLAKEYGPKVATSIMSSNEKHEKVIIVDNPKSYAKSNPKFVEALKRFYRMKEFNIEDIKEKFYYYDKKADEVCPGSWDD